MILLVACVAVISGTLFPVLSEWVRGTKISVGAPFFNKVNLPIAHVFAVPDGRGAAAGLAQDLDEQPAAQFRRAAAGRHCGRRLSAWRLGLRNFYVIVCLILSVFVTLTILLEFYRGARVIAARSGHRTCFRPSAQLTMRNTRRYGGYVVHFGIVLIFIGIAGTAFNQDKQMEMPRRRADADRPLPSDAIRPSIRTPEANYTSERATIAVDRDGKQVIMLYPERRFYPANQESGTMVAIYSTLKEDLYVVYAGRSPDTQQPVIHAYLNPLVKWIWLGGAIVVLGTLLALVPNRQPVLALRAVAEAAPAGRLSPAPCAVIPTTSGMTGMTRLRQIRARIRLLAAAVVLLDTGMLQGQSVRPRQSCSARKLMCMCGCDQILTACNHVGCPLSVPDAQGDGAARRIAAIPTT